MLLRLVTGLRSFRHAVMLAPEAWSAMAVRLASKPELQRFAFDVLSALSAHSGHKLPDTLWICISMILHKLANKPPNL